MLQKEKVSCEICLLISESTSEPPPTREVTADAFVAARPRASNPCQAPDCGDCALQAAFLCVFARFCACRESNMGKKIIQVYTNLSQKTTVVATGQNYLLKA